LEQQASPDSNCVAAQRFAMPEPRISLMFGNEQAAMQLPLAQLGRPDYSFGSLDGSVNGYGLFVIRKLIWKYFGPLITDNL